MARRGNKMYEVLRALETSAKFIADIIDHLAPLDRRFRYRFKDSPEQIEAQIDSRLAQRQRQRIYHLVYKLRKQGLLQERGGRQWITKRGKAKLNILRKMFTRIIPMKKYPVISASEVVIVSFDIPEKERYKRNWLRSVLTNLGMKMQHESLWIGKRGIPKELIADIEHYGLSDCVAIFAVTKHGTLKELI